MNTLNIDNKYIKRIIDTDPTISEDSILTLSKKSPRMTSLVDTLPNFEIIVLSDRLEEERRNPFIVDTKQGVVTCSYLDVIDGMQHEVTPTEDPEWVDIEGIGQVNKYLVGLLGLWKGLQFKYEALQEILDSGGTQFTKTQVRKAKREYMAAEQRFFREQLREQTKVDLVRLSEATDKKLEGFKKELNHNVAVAGNTALKAIEQNDETKALLAHQVNEEQDKLMNFLKEFDTKASQFQNEIYGTALTSKDIKDMATLTNIDELNSRVVEYYSKLETTKNTIISLTNENSKEQMNTLLTLCGNLEKGLNQHQKKFDSFLKNFHVDYEKSVASIKEIAVAAISGSKLPEKLALTTNFDKDALKPFLWKNLNNRCS
ncbi:hypothetical protein U3516DRAFT_847900 [Neocallimastix sp. 'constans']